MTHKTAYAKFVSQVTGHLSIVVDSSTAALFLLNHHTVSANLKGASQVTIYGNNNKDQDVGKLMVALQNIVGFGNVNYKNIGDDTASISSNAHSTTQVPTLGRAKNGATTTNLDDGNEALEDGEPKEVSHEVDSPPSPQNEATSSESIAKTASIDKDENHYAGVPHCVWMLILIGFVMLGLYYYRNTAGHKDEKDVTKATKGERTPLLARDEEDTLQTSQ